MRVCVRKGVSACMLMNFYVDLKDKSIMCECAHMLAYVLVYACICACKYAIINFTSYYSGQVKCSRLNGSFNF